MSIASELSSEVAIAALCSGGIKQTSELFNALLQIQSTLRTLSQEERRRHARFFQETPPRTRKAASANL
jgi:NMD protein affecting ribosome stability and mRNA decay